MNPFPRAFVRLELNGHEAEVSVNAASVLEQQGVNFRAAVGGPGIRRVRAQGLDDCGAVPWPTASVAQR